MAIDQKSAIEFLNECAKYFERKPDNGEDCTFWANVNNARICREIADLLND